MPSTKLHVLKRPTGLHLSINQALARDPNAKMLVAIVFR